MWCIPPKQSGEFVYHMEDVLDVYHRPYDPRRPVVCLDETFKQLIGEVREPLPAAPGRVERYDGVYVRNGVASLFMAFEPLAGWRHVELAGSRTAKDWARVVKGLVDSRRYRDAEKLVLVMYQLNTHGPWSLYEALPPDEARRVADKLEIPPHATARLVAEHGRDRAQRLRARTARAGGRRAGHGVTRGGVGEAAQRRQGEGGLAVHHRRRAGQAPQALPDSGRMTEY